MSLFQTLFTCVFTLYCNLLFQPSNQPSFPTRPCPPHTSRRNLLVSPLFPLQVSSSSVVLTAPWLPLHFFLEFRSVTTVKSCMCINWQAWGFWQRWTLLSFLWQDTTRSLSSTQMSSLVKTDQGGAKNIVSIWERTIAQERMVSLDQTVASTFC